MHIIFLKSLLKKNTTYLYMASTKIIMKAIIKEQGKRGEEKERGGLEK